MSHPVHGDRQNAPPCRILLVEDNLGDARLFSESLPEAASRYRVRHVRRLGDAVEILTRETFDIVVTDLALPDAVGLDSVRRILAQSPATPLVVLSDLSEPDLATEAIRLGARQFLSKDTSDAGAIAHALEHARTSRTPGGPERRAIEKNP